MDRRTITIEVALARLLLIVLLVLSFRVDQHRTGTPPPIPYKRPCPGSRAINGPNFSRRGPRVRIPFRPAVSHVTLGRICQRRER
jgi:hypothetical protein